MSRSVLLSVDDLSVRVGSTFLLRGVSFTLAAGESLTLLGESGAGKSLLAQAVMGNLPTSLLASGQVSINGDPTPAADGASRRPLWGRKIALLPQEPTLALNPLRRLAPQLSEVGQLVCGVDASAAQNDARQRLTSAGLAAAAEQFSWQLSGGMAQRAAMTIALAGGSRIVLADEPTKGLDSEWRDYTVAALQAVQHEGGCIAVITHDLRVARALGGRVAVLRAGEVVESGDTAQVLTHPQHEFTRALLAGEPSSWPRSVPPARGPVVATAEKITKSFGGRTLFEGLDVQLCAGDRKVIQGPSGCGKSTFGNVLLGLLTADAGRVTRAPGLAPTAFQKLYQDPVASFAPHVSLEQSLRDAATHFKASWQVVTRRLQRLNLPDSLLARKPHQVSGGELQRIALARVLLARPALVFADEPTSRLDAVSQREAISVLLEAINEIEAALVFVTHDDDLADAVSEQRLLLR
ncbi:MAG: ABC transporter ATP-binding protein [Betaproteobacteria bacterium]|nr:MAG: ABC transporter ATP-binding protein [Betaproteobacteria bacterium]